MSDKETGRLQTSEMDTRQILTQLCTRARMVYKTSTPFRNQAIAIDEAESALATQASKDKALAVVEARIEELMEFGPEQVYQYAGGSRFTVGQRLAQLQAERKKLLGDV